MDGSNELYKADEEECQGALKEERQEIGDFEHSVFKETLMPKVTNATTLPWGDTLRCHVFAQPLFDQNAERSSNQTAAETDEPQGIESNSTGSCMERWRKGGRVKQRWPYT